MPWGLAGKPIDDETLDAVAKLREALRGELGEQAVRALANREIDALHARVVALLDNPLVPTPDRRRPSRGRPSSTYVSLSVAKISNSSLSSASASAAPTGPA